jgi:hypothetical protein
MTERRRWGMPTCRPQQFTSVKYINKHFYSSSGSGTETRLEKKGLGRPFKELQKWHVARGGVMCHLSERATQC